MMSFEKLPLALARMNGNDVMNKKGKLRAGKLQNDLEDSGG